MSTIVDTILDLGFDDAIIFTDPSYEDAIIGISLDGNVIYDYDKMIKYLMDKNHMTYDDAVEWIDYNVISQLLYIDKKLPIIIHCFND